MSFVPSSPRSSAASNVRVTQLGAEAIGEYTNRLRVNQSGLEAIGEFVLNLRVDQLGLEAIGVAVPLPSPMRVNQLGAEAIGLPISNARVNQLGLEAIGVPPLTPAFIVTEWGNYESDTTAKLWWSSLSSGLVDTGGWLKMQNNSQWRWQNGSRLYIANDAVVTSVGGTTLNGFSCMFNVVGGTVSFGRTTASICNVTLGDGNDPNSFNVSGTLTADDSSSFNLGTIPSGSGAAAFTIGPVAKLTMQNAAFALVGTLDLEAVNFPLIGYGFGDGVWSNGGVLANFTFIVAAPPITAHTVIFTDTTYAPPTFASSLTHFWSFGDGGTSVLPNPIYSYAAPGTYVVTHQVNALGATSVNTQSVTVT